MSLLENSRVKLDVSRQAMGKAIGVSRQSIWAFENDVRIPSRRLAFKIIDFFNAHGIKISINDLITRGE